MSGVRPTFARAPASYPHSVFSLFFALRAVVVPSVLVSLPHCGRSSFTRFMWAALGFFWGTWLWGRLASGLGVLPAYPVAPVACVLGSESFYFAHALPASALCRSGLPLPLLHAPSLLGLVVRGAARTHRAS